jgi:hypothetical protein
LRNFSAFEEEHKGEKIVVLAAGNIFCVRADCDNGLSSQLKPTILSVLGSNPSFDFPSAGSHVQSRIAISDPVVSEGFYRTFRRDALV